MEKLRTLDEITGDFGKMKITDVSGFIAETDDCLVVEKHIMSMKGILVEACALHSYILETATEISRLFGCTCPVAVAEADEHILILIEELSSYLKTAEQALEKRRSLCDHDWVSTGHDSHYDYYRCTKCGKEDKI